MRKIYVIALMLLIVGSVSAQKHKMVKIPKKQIDLSFQKVGNHQETTLQSLPKSVNANLSQDFELTAFPPASWSLDPTTGSEWYHSTETANGVDLNSVEPTITGHTGHVAIFDDFNGALNLEGSLVTPVLHPVNGNNTFSYTVSLVQVSTNPAWQGAGAMMYIEFSADGGTTWTTSTTNVLATLPSYNTATTPAPVTQTASLAAYNGMAVQVRFRCVSDYGWCMTAVDNVTGPDADVITAVNDIQIGKSYIDFSGMSFYASTPITQLGAINFGAAISNIGSAAQTNVTLTADGNNGTFIANTGTNNPIVSLAAGSNDTLYAELTTPAAIAAFYNVAISVDADQTDEDLTNNVDSAWYMTDSVLYLRAGNWNQALTSYSFGTSAPAITGMEFGSNYHFTADGIVDNIYVPVYKVSGNPTMIGKLYEVSLIDGTRNLIGETNPYTPSTGEDVYLPLQTPISVYANTIVTVTTQLNIVVGTDTIFLYQDSPFYGNAQQGAAYLQVSGTWGWYYLTGSMPAVGLTMQLPVNISNINGTKPVGVFPNPTTGLLHIINAENATVSVFNIMGQEVMSAYNVKTLDMSSMANGSYFVKVQTDSNVITKKINLVK